MAFIHNHSCECTKAELDLFQLPATQTSVEAGDWIPYKPVAAINQEAPIEFHVPSHSDEYLDLSQTLMVIRAKLVKADGTALEEDAKVAPINNFLHSMFSDVMVSFNQKTISSASNLYPYRAYIETLFNYNSEAKVTRCQCEAWFEDTAGKMDDTGDTNDGFLARQSLSSLSRTFEMIGRPHCDVIGQNRYLPNGVDLAIKLIPSRSAFCLIAETNTAYKAHIVDATLLVRKLSMSPSVLLGHAKALEKANYKLPVVRVDMKCVTIPANVQSKSIANHYLGQMPTRLVVGFVTNAALNGSMTTNPFNFHHHDLSYLSIYIDGRQIPSRPLQPNYADDDYLEAYFTTFSGTGIGFRDDGHCIQRAQYPLGYCLYAFDLTSDMSANDVHWSLRKNGTLNIEVKFSKSLTAAVSCVTLAEFQNLVEIDKQRNVIVDY